MLVLALTFWCYTAYHASRKPPSIVKTVLHGDAGAGEGGRGREWGGGCTGWGGGCTGWFSAGEGARGAWPRRLAPPPTRLQSGMSHADYHFAASHRGAWPPPLLLLLLLLLLRLPPSLRCCAPLTPPPTPTSPGHQVFGGGSAAAPAPGAAPLLAPAPGGGGNASLPVGGGGADGAGWAPFNNPTTGKSLLGDMDVAFLGAYAGKQRVGGCVWGGGVGGGDMDVAFLGAYAGKQRVGGCVCLGGDARVPHWWYVCGQRGGGQGPLLVLTKRPPPPPPPLSPSVGMFVSGHLGDRVDLRHFLTGGWVGWGGWRVLPCIMLHLNLPACLPLHRHPPTHPPPPPFHTHTHTTTQAACWGLGCAWLSLVPPTFWTSTPSPTFWRCRWWEVRRGARACVWGGGGGGGV